MKFQIVLAISALCAVVQFSACKSDNAATKASAGDNTGVQPGSTVPATDAATDAVAAPTELTAPSSAAQTFEPLPVPAPGATPTPAPEAAPKEPAQNAAGVWHYTCSKGCKGGAGSASACSKCGTTLVHNAVYHGPEKPASPAAKPPTAKPETADVKKPEPPQNKAGVWHYTCAGGCAGGSGTATACAKCSKTLVHNPAYHQ